MTPIQQAAQLACDDIYDPITPGAFNKVYRVGDTVCGTALINDVCWVVCQGTENRPGWMADVDIRPTLHPLLGDLHTGFYDNLPELVRQMLPELPRDLPVIVTGHSKGAGEAAILGALLEIERINVMREVLFACPHPGTVKLTEWLKGHIPGVSYRNAPAWRWGGDPVPLVPVTPYVSPYPLTYINEPPAGFKRLLGACWHAGDLYIKGLAT